MIGQQPMVLGAFLFRELAGAAQVFGIASAGEPGVQITDFLGQVFALIKYIYAIFN